jgi:hypothetical protein
MRVIQAQKFLPYLAKLRIGSFLDTCCLRLLNMPRFERFFWGKIGVRPPAFLRKQEGGGKGPKGSQGSKEMQDPKPMGTSRYVPMGTSNNVPTTNIISRELKNGNCYR